MAGDPAFPRRNVKDTAPFILTAELPPDLHSWATRLRARHFPPERNFLEAHVTLFHALPPQTSAELTSLLVHLAGKTVLPQGRLDGILNLGRGTALKIMSEDLLALRDRIADHFHGLLTAQDRHRPRLHITIQNKVPPGEARTLQSELTGTIGPRDFTFPGMALFRYRGGPWEAVRRFAFRSPGRRR